MWTLKPVVSRLQSVATPLRWKLANRTRHALPDRISAQRSHGIGMSHVSCMIAVQPAFDRRRIAQAVGRGVIVNETPPSPLREISIAIDPHAGFRQVDPAVTVRCLHFPPVIEARAGGKLVVDAAPETDHLEDGTRRWHWHTRCQARETAVDIAAVQGGGPFVQVIFGVPLRRHCTVDRPAQVRILPVGCQRAVLLIVHADDKVATGPGRDKRRLRLQCRDRGRAVIITERMRLTGKELRAARNEEPHVAAHRIPARRSIAKRRRRTADHLFQVRLAADDLEVNLRVLSEYLAGCADHILAVDPVAGCERRHHLLQVQVHGVIRDFRALAFTDLGVVADHHAPVVCTRVAVLERWLVGRVGFAHVHDPAIRDGSHRKRIAAFCWCSQVRATMPAEVEADRIGAIARCAFQHAGRAYVTVGHDRVARIRCGHCIVLLRMGG